MSTTSATTGSSTASATGSSNPGNILIADLPPPLHSHTSPNIALSIKLNQDFIHQLKSHMAKSPSSSSGNKVKLVVKNGQVSIKLNEQIQYPCLKFPENLTIDVYSNNNYDGRIINKLTVVTDSKKIKQYNNSNSVGNDTEKDREANSNVITPISTPRDLHTPIIPSNNNRKEKPLSPQKQKSVMDVYGGKSHNPYKVLNDGGDSRKPLDPMPTIFKKFLHLVALGPITLSHILTILDCDKEEIYKWLTDYGQKYNPNDQFIQQDKFPYSDYNYGDDNDSNSKSVKDNNYGLKTSFILKDKSYKELLPWKWPYTDYERALVLNNVNNALTRIGFSLTHPLRKKIINNDNESNNKSTSNNNGEEKARSLGGGLLVSKKKFPIKPPVASTPPPPQQQPQQQKSTSTSTTITTSPKSSTNTIELNKKGNRINKLISKSPSGINTPLSSSDISSKSSKSRKRKLSTSSSSSSSNSSLSDDNLTSNIGSTSINSTNYKLNYNSPPSEQEFDDHYYSSSSSSSTTTNSTFALSNQDQHNLSSSSSSTSKMDYYTNLANKFRIKYKEYSQLYNHLLTNSSTNDNDGSNTNYKKNLMKLFELHQLLSQWKKLLWDFDKDLKLKQNLNQLHVQKRDNKTVSTTTNIATTRNSNSASSTSGASGGNKSPSKKRKLVMDY